MQDGLLTYPLKGLDSRHRPACLGSCLTNAVVSRRSCNTLPNIHHNLLWPHALTWGCALSAAG